MRNLLGDFYIRLLAFGALLVVLVLAYFAIQILLVPFVAALFVAYLFEPGIVELQRRGVERGNAFLLLLTATIVGI
ncbi:MAG: AI-2E family transporter, partial [Acidobacteria bacterium]|nr:AI-2E family transporter [Acidobacteriota bacterium]